jgi:3-hydroxybutyrate dehydrogenase
MGELDGKVAWITGGASGMGFACALDLAKRGAAIAIGSLTPALGVGTIDPGQRAFMPDDDLLARARQRIAEAGVPVLALPLDVRSDASVADSHRNIVEELGEVDILINAAGTSGRAAMADHPDGLWHALLDVNLTGSYRTTKICLPGMIARGWGRIVMFSSTAGLNGHALHAAYCASKSGLLGLMRCVALEGAPHGVTCNAICPGWVATEQNVDGCIQEMALLGLDMTVEEYRAAMAEKWVPRKRFLEPQEPGAYVGFLCTDAARGITGEALRISGGSLW